MSCLLRSSDVARRRNDVVLDMREDEYEVESDEDASRHVGNVRDKLVETVRRHVGNELSTTSAMNGICSEKRQCSKLD